LTTHAPTPWALDKRVPTYIVDAGGHCFAAQAVSGITGREDAKHIVQCVNAHDDLVTLLLRAADELNDLANPLGKEIDEYLIRIHKAKETS
jgi:t-SNARE complex subunit (syntaxin)